MVRLGFATRVAVRCGPNHWTGLKIPTGRDLGPRFSLETPHRPIKVIGLAMVTHSITQQLASLSGDCCAPSSTYQLITIGCLVKPHRSQRRDNLALHGQTRMSRIMCGLERALVSTLEAVVLARAHGDLEGFARYILQTTTAGVVESWPAQRFAVTAAVADAQPTVLPQLALRSVCECKH